MGKFAPVFLAYVQNCFGVNIFRESTPGCEPLISCLIFLTALFFLLWDMRLYPSSLRKMAKLSSCVIEYLLAAFIMEHIMTDFWFPLESTVMTLLPKIAAQEEQLLKAGGWHSGGVFSLLKYNGTQVFASYFMSLFFLFAVLHATRVVDFRLLNCGPSVFFKDLIQKLKKFRKKITKFLSRRKQVKFKLRSRSKSLASSCGSSDNDDCNCPCNYDDIEDDDDMLPDDILRHDRERFDDDDCVNYSYSRKY